MRIRESIAVLVGAALLAPGVALAAPQCFQVFSGVYVRFEQPITETETAQEGRVLGSFVFMRWAGLLACGGQLAPQQDRRLDPRLPRVYCRRQHLWRG